MNYFNEVDIFEDGWVFLIQGSNNVKKYWIDGGQLPENVLKRWSDIYRVRLDFFAKHNIQHLNIFAPEKLSIYPEKTSYSIVDKCIPSFQLLNYLKMHLPDSEDLFLDLIPFLRKQSEKYLTYHKTDSHWNFFGAFSAYQMIQGKLNESTYSAALQRPQIINWNVMDLGGKFDPPLREETFFYQASDNFKRIYANDLVEFKERENRENDAGLHVGSYVTFENKNSLSNKVVMIFGDSFSEYRDHLLTGLMAETYKQVHFIWNNRLDFELILKVQPDIVISEMAERFISNPPMDGLC